MVIVTDGTAINGRTGKAAWRAPEARAYLFSANPREAPRILEGTLSPDAATVCRVVTRLDGISSPERAVLQRGSAEIRDPRFSRALPWVLGPIDTRAGAVGVALLGGLALTVFVIPLLVLRWAGRHDRRSLKVLLVLPVLVAVILATFGLLNAILPPMPMPDWQLCLFDILMAIFGLPIVLYGARVGQSIASGRWSRLILFAGLTLLVTAMIAGSLIAYDTTRMASFEYYRWTGVAISLGLGIYALGSLMLARSVLRRATRVARWTAKAAWRRFATVAQ
jgi:hypothetical protein